MPDPSEYERLSREVATLRRQLQDREQIIARLRKQLAGAENRKLPLVEIKSTVDAIWHFVQNGNSVARSVFLAVQDGRQGNSRSMLRIAAALHAYLEEEKQCLMQKD